MLNPSTITLAARRSKIRWPSRGPSLQARPLPKRRAQDFSGRIIGEWRSGAAWELKIPGTRPLPKRGLDRSRAIRWAPCGRQTRAARHQVSQAQKGGRGLSACTRPFRKAQPIQGADTSRIAKATLCALGIHPRAELLTCRAEVPLQTGCGSI